MRAIPSLALLLPLAVAACTESPTTSADDPSLVSAATPTVFNTQLRPENEIRTDETDPVESVAFGHVQLKLLSDNTVSFKITVNNPEQEVFVAGHIHQAPVGVNGAIVVPLFEGASFDDAHLKLEGTVDAPPDIAAALLEDPSGFYVNLHTTQDPQGAMRGQLP